MSEVKSKPIEGQQQGGGHMGHEHAHKHDRVTKQDIDKQEVMQHEVQHPKAKCRFASSVSLNVNPPGIQPVITRDQLWTGLVRKAEQPGDFIPAITKCTITNREGDNVFLRDIECKGQVLKERVTLEKENGLIKFERYGDSHEMGVIMNLIEGGPEPQTLLLQFSYDLYLANTELSSLEEKNYQDKLSHDFLEGINSTLTTIRKCVANK
jgi:hypothetical protein